MLVQSGPNVFPIPAKVFFYDPLCYLTAKLVNQVTDQLHKNIVAGSLLRDGIASQSFLDFWFCTESPLCKKVIICTFM